MQDLWPQDILVTDAKAPVTILKEQATFLGAKTSNIVEAVVRRKDREIDVAFLDEIHGPLSSGAPSRPRPIKEDEFTYSFAIRAPALGNYHYKVFEISYGVDFYPVKIRTESEIKQEIGYNADDDIVVDSEDEFVHVLSQLFGARKTKQVVSAILAQSLQ